MAVRRINADDIHARCNQRRDALEHIMAHTNRRAAEQAAGGVLRGIRILLRLLNILDGNQATQMTLFIHQRELLDAMLGQNLARLLVGRAHRRGDQILARHDLVDRAGIVGFKAEIAVGQNADQLARLIGNRHAGNAVARHQLFRVGNKVVRAEVERIGNNAVLRALHAVNLLRLLLDGHVLVDDAQTAFARHGDGRLGLRHRIHGRRQERDIQLDLIGQIRFQLYFLGQHLAAARNQQNIIKKSVPHESLSAACFLPPVVFPELCGLLKQNVRKSHSKMGFELL